MPFNIFISWSESTSQKIAEALKSFLNKVFERDEVECWTSKDIPAGSDWYAANKDALNKADFGVICFTPENLESQWLQFEGGALVTSILGRSDESIAPVCPYLFEVGQDLIPDTFSRWQSVNVDREGTKELFESINSRLKAPKTIPKKRFGDLFKMHWGTYEKELPNECPHKPMVATLEKLTDSFTKKIASELKIPVNPYAESLLLNASQTFFNNFSVEDGIVTFKAPPSTYPDHLLLLLKKFHIPVKAIAVVDDMERFWQSSTGDDIYIITPPTSQRVFVFRDVEHLEKSFDFFIRHANKYNVYAISSTELEKRFGEHAQDFSIIGVQDTKILAKYERTEHKGKIKSIMFTTNPEVIHDYEDAFDRIIIKSAKMTVDSTKEITEAQKKNFIEKVFKDGVKEPLPHESIEMSAYVSVPQYGHFEEYHAYFIDMMERMLEHFEKNRKKDVQCRVLELGAGTGHFTRRLIRSGNLLVTAVEIDWACYHYLWGVRETLRSALETIPPLHDTPNYKLSVVFADSCKFSDPDGNLFDFIFSSFADHHIKPADKEQYFKNIKKNLSPNGMLIVGDEFIPSYDPGDEESFRSAVTRYHNHIIDKAREDGHDELVDLETAAMNSGLERRGDFKMPIEEYEKHLRAAGLIPISREKIGPKDRDDLGGIYVYVIRKK